MRLSRAAAAALVVGALLSASCGAAQDEGNQQEGKGGTRQVGHVMGTTEVPASPNRVVVLDTGELDSMIALGLTPVGAVEAIAREGFPDYLADKVRGVQKVGTIQQPNVEAIAALKPELILSSKLRHEAIYDQLSRVAPTVFTERTGSAWKQNFRLHAEAVGKTQEGERLMQEYERKTAAFKAAMGERLTQTEISVVRSVGDEVRIYQKDNFIGTVLADAGLPRPKPQDVAKFAATATVETIPNLEGDVMFLSKYGNDHGLLAQLAQSPLWGRLEVVRQDQVYEVPDDLWFLGIGNLAARLVVDDLHAILVEGKRLPGDQPGVPLD